MTHVPITFELFSQERYLGLIRYKVMQTLEMTTSEKCILPENFIKLKQMAQLLKKIKPRDEMLGFQVSSRNANVQFKNTNFIRSDLFIVDQSTKTSFFLPYYLMQNQTRLQIFVQFNFFPVVFSRFHHFLRCCG